MKNKLYGELTGKIVSISSDSRIDNSSGVAYYIAECELDNTEIKSKNSEVKNITSGNQNPPLLIYSKGGFRGYI